jgi:hypothetical protein
MKFLVEISFFLDHLRTDTHRNHFACHCPSSAACELAGPRNPDENDHPAVIVCLLSQSNENPNRATHDLHHLPHPIPRLRLAAGLLSVSNRDTAARIASKTPRNDSGSLGPTKSRGNAAAHSVGRFIPCGFGGRTLQSQLLTNIYRPACLLSNFQIITAPFLIRSAACPI